MPVKSIIDIDINDAKFSAFKRLFDQYDAAVKKMPAAWNNVNATVAGTADSFKALVQVTSSVVGAVRQIEKSQAANTKQTSAWERAWTRVARDTREVASNIRQATTSLLKWVSVTGLISGLVGAGSLFGIDRLAAGVAGSRRSALGLGTTIGQQAAFGSNLSRLVDPEAFLSSVAGAKFDLSRRVGLVGAGLSEKQIAGDTTQTAVTLLRRLKEIADTTNPALYQQVLQARRLDQFAAPTDLERLRNTSGGEFEQLLRQFKQRSGQFDLPPDTARKWQDFITQMSNAGKSIETTFVKGLAPLSVPLTKLSESVEKVITALTKEGGPLEQWIVKLGGAIERFAVYIGKPEFQEDVARFVDGVSKVSSAVASFASWFGTPSRRKAGDPNLPEPPTPQPGGMPAPVGFRTIRTAGGKKVTVAEDSADRFKGFLDALEGAGAPIHSIGGYNPRKIAGTDKWSEHAFGRAIDLNQTARDQVTDDFRQWVENHRQFMKRLTKHYGIVSGGDFKSPDLGHFEVAKGAGGYAQPQPTVTINDNTGGNVNVSVNGLKD